MNLQQKKNSKICCPCHERLNLVLPPCVYLICHKLTTSDEEGDHQNKDKIFLLFFLFNFFNELNCC